MSKHTPGPWIIRGQDIIGNEINGYICTWSGRSANANLIAAAPAMYELIEKFGDAVTDMFEQMEKGNWVDDHGHRVQMNKQMMNLVPIVNEAIALRAPIRGES